MPSFQSMMRPAIALHADGDIMARPKLVAGLADHFQLSDSDRGAYLEKSGRRVFDNRVAWATTHLTKAGLLERPGAGKTRITAAGHAALLSHPEALSMQTLRGLSPAYAAWQSRPAGGGAPAPEPGLAPANEGQVPPNEAVEQVHAGLQAALAAELLDRLRTADPGRFEAVVIELLQKMGYGASARRLGGKGADEGVDGVIEQDKLGLDRIYVQAKRYAEGNNVGGPAIQAFAGALNQKGASGGVFIATSRFTPAAEKAKDQMSANIALVDGERLAALMIEHNVGVRVTAEYRVQQLDEGYFADA